MQILFKIILVSIFLFLTNCTINKILTINENNLNFKIDTSLHSKNYSSRISYVVLHNTSYSSFDSSVNWLIGSDSINQVSAHYLINNKIDDKNKSYIYQLVKEKDKSWHTGISAWQGINNLNISSIGIDNVNEDGNINEYPENQIIEIINLCKYLKDKYNIKDVNFVGHSDISVGRKFDPGTKFPWKRLYENGVGAWYDSLDVDSLRKVITILPQQDTIISKLIKYGYTPLINQTNSNQINQEEFERIVLSFKRHFRPLKVDGKIDIEDYIALLALLKKYR